MSDASNQAAITIPPLYQSLLRALAQKGVTVAATALTGWGVLDKDQTGAFISFGVAAALWVVSFGWTYYQEHKTKAVLVAAVAAPANPVAAAKALAP